MKINETIKNLDKLTIGVRPDTKGETHQLCCVDSGAILLYTGESPMRYSSFLGSHRFPSDTHVIHNEVSFGEVKVKVPVVEELEELVDMLDVSGRVYEIPNHLRPRMTAMLSMVEMFSYHNLPEHGMWYGPLEIQFVGKDILHRMTYDDKVVVYNDYRRIRDQHVITSCHITDEDFVHYLETLEELHAVLQSMIDVVESHLEPLSPEDIQELARLRNERRERFMEKLNRNGVYGSYGTPNGELDAIVDDKRG